MWTESTRSGVRYVERYTDPLTNQQKKVSVSFDKDTKRNQKEAYYLLQAKIEELTELYSDDVRFGVLCERYLDQYTDSRKESSKRTATAQIKCLLDVLGSYSTMSKLSARYVKKEIAAYKTTKINKNALIKRFKAVIRWGFKNDYVEDVTFLDKIDLYDVRTEKRSIEDKYLDHEQIFDFLSGTDDRKLVSIWEFLILTGMRCGEFLALDKSDVDLENRTISITKTYDYVEKTLTSTKNQSSNREIYIQDELVPVIHTINSCVAVEKLRSGHRSEAFCPDQDGSRYTYQKIMTRFRATRKRAALPEIITIHALRHTHASLLAESGMPYEEIAQRLGHKNDKITREIYIHITDKRKAEMNKHLDKISLISS